MAASSRSSPAISPNAARALDRAAFGKSSVNLGKYLSNVAELDRMRLSRQTSAPFSASRLLAKLLVLHGPNLNLLGMREPEVYGRTTLAAIDAELAATAQASGHELATFQSNAETS